MNLQKGTTLATSVGHFFKMWLAFAPHISPGLGQAREVNSVHSSQVNSTSGMSSGHHMAAIKFFVSLH